MTVTGLWDLVRPLMKEVKGGQDLSEILDRSVVVVDLSRWIMEANLKGQRQAAASSSITFQSQNAGDGFILVTAFRRLVQLLCLGSWSVIGVLDSRVVRSGKKGKNGSYKRFGERLYAKLRKLFSTLHCPIVEAEGEGEQLAAAIQRHLEKQQPRRRIFVDAEDSDVLLYGATSVLKDLSVFKMPTEKAADFLLMNKTNLNSYQGLEQHSMTPSPKQKSEPIASRVKDDHDLFSSDANAELHRRLLSSTSTNSSFQTPAKSDDVLARLLRNREERRAFLDAEPRKLVFSEKDAAETSNAKPETEEIIDEVFGTLSSVELAFLATVSGSDFAQGGARKGLGIRTALKALMHLRYNTSSEAIKELQRQRIREKRKDASVRSDLLGLTREKQQDSPSAVEYFEGTFRRREKEILRSAIESTYSDQEPHLVKAFEDYVQEVN